MLLFLAGWVLYAAESQGTLVKGESVHYAVEIDWPSPRLPSGCQLCRGWGFALRLWALEDEGTPSWQVGSHPCPSVLGASLAFTTAVNGSSAGFCPESKTCLSWTLSKGLRVKLGGFPCKILLGGHCFCWTSSHPLWKVSLLHVRLGDLSCGTLGATSE